MNRLLLFAHYNKYDDLADYVLYLLQQIRHIYSRIIFISNSAIDNNARQKLNEFCHEIIVRENKDFDFGAWKDVILKEGWDKLSQYDNVTLLNDSCFGPLFDMKPVYAEMEQKRSDFWGLTIQNKRKYGLITQHIQSYFICFGRNVVSSKVFQKFWINLKCPVNIHKKISKYEVQLTAALKKGGFNFDAVYDPCSVDFDKDSVLFRPDLIIKNKVPLIKVKSFRCFPHQRYIVYLLQKETSYPVKLIFDHITDTCEPGTSLQLCQKTVPVTTTSVYIPASKVAIHLHIYYLDVFEDYLFYLNKMQAAFDLFITTDTTDKEIQIKIRLKGTKLEDSTKIRIVENRGRDIFPWLNLADILNEYDIVGHFHTKKSTHGEEWLGITWMQEIFELVLVPFNEIIEIFEKNKKIGVVIPDMPYCFQAISPYIEYNTYMFALLNGLWKRMNCHKMLDFQKLEMLIFSYGSMFWYRPEALRSLFQLHLSASDFEPEPLPVVSLAHSIERIFVYAAWNNGFDYRIVTHPIPKTSNFVHTGIVNRQYKQFYFSGSYKIGEAVLVLPRLIKKILREILRLLKKILKKMIKHYKSK